MEANPSKTIPAIDCKAVLSVLEADNSLKLPEGLLLWDDVDNLLDSLEKNIVKNASFSGVQFIQPQDFEDIVYALQNSAQFLETVSISKLNLVGAAKVATALAELVNHS